MSAARVESTSTKRQLNVSRDVETHVLQVRHKMLEGDGADVPRGPEITLHKLLTKKSIVLNEFMDGDRCVCVCALLRWM